MDKLVATSVLDWEKNSEQELIEKINKLIVAQTDWIHYDVMDDKFVPRLTTWNDLLVKVIPQTKNHYVDFHIMVKDPEKFICKYRNVANSITFHFEPLTYREISQLIKNYRNKNLKLGIAINPKTNIEQVYEFLPDLDMVLVMSVVPGKGGQSFIENSYTKVKRLREYIAMKGLKTVIQVDGGIKKNNASHVFNSGANVIVSGSYVTRSDDYQISINNLKN